MDFDDTNRLMTRREVSKVTTLSRTTLWRYVDEKRFPEPRRIPGGPLVWRVGDVLRWIEELPPAKKDANARWKSLMDRQIERKSK